MSPSDHLSDDHIVHQMKHIGGELANKSEDRIERDHQDGKYSERLYLCYNKFSILSNIIIKE